MAARRLLPSFVLLLARLAWAEPPPLELVESWPLETPLDHPDLRDAAQVWPEMLGGARRTIDIAEFYLSGDEGSRLEPVVAAILAAARRGVTVRVLGDARFAGTYPEILERLARAPNVEVRRYDFGKVGGGVLHAKYFIVDGSVAFLGSQNFDWRSLTHIQELGLRATLPEVVRGLADVFETDWALAGGADPTTRVSSAAPDAPGVSFVASPRGWLPDESAWDLPRIVELLDGAKRTVRVQLLSYQATHRGEYWDELEDALRRAAARGVTVQLMVADWAKRPGSIEGLKSLAVLPNVAVKLVTIPPFSGGFIPFARVVHAKYLVVDGERAWLGTSNWEKDYFYASRNVGVIVGARPFADRLDRFFLDLWQTDLAVPIDPAASYTPPRRE
jgi:phosphatidylserine/phosphatidylglycerophosphate/cardiolipin synthase-like enzyme